MTIIFIVLNVISFTSKYNLFLPINIQNSSAESHLTAAVHFEKQTKNFTFFFKREQKWSSNSRLTKVFVDSRTAGEVKSCLR